ncbi:phospholipase D-like protein [Marivita geojedonensis]|nr:phospholipase D-like protein [Marivita geojedonensis]
MEPGERNRPTIRIGGTGITRDASKDAPKGLTGGKESKMGIEITGIGGFILLVLNVWAFVSIIGSKNSTGSKVLWCLLVLILPLLGFIIWLIAGPRSASSRA